MDFSKMFPDERTKGETPQRQAQLVMLRMLKIADYLCTLYNIEYFLIGGSLLGAIRHQGFIAWDDDLDIGMTRENYERFVQYAVPQLPPDIFFQNPDTDIHYPQNNNVEARLRDKYSSYVHLDGSVNPWHEGLQVDIFVYDRAFIPHAFFVIALNSLMLKLFNNKQKRAKALKLISKYVPLPLAYSSSNCQAFKDLKEKQIHIIYKKEIDKLIRTKFEDMQVTIPQGWDACLKRHFDNYMQMPAVEERVGPHRVQVRPFTPCNHTQALHWSKTTQDYFPAESKKHFKPDENAVA